MRLPFVVLATTLCACGPSRPADGLWFEEGAPPPGARNRTGAQHKPFVTDSFGAGIALRDFDGDGVLDLFVVGGGEADQGHPDTLHLGRGDGTFGPAQSGLPMGDGSWSYGVNACDFDGDGDCDLYVTRRGPNRLLRNHGDGTFEEVAAELGLADAGWSTGAAWFDQDLDGRLDLFVVNHIEFDQEATAGRGPSRFLEQDVYYGPTGLTGQHDRLYRAREDGTFSDVSEEVGLTQAAHFGFQVIVFDEDGDGRTDLYVANDTTPNQLWRNASDGVLRDVAGELGCALSMEGGPQAGMGVALGDADGDGLPEMFVTNFSSDYFTLYQRGADGFWRDRTTRSRLHAPTWNSLGWACGFDDLDADGDVDLWAFNGHVYPQMDQVPDGPGYRQLPQVFENDGRARFLVPATGGGPAFSNTHSGRGGAVGDLDGDLDLDLVMGVLDGTPQVLLNEGAQGAALMLRLEGQGGNKEAIGARVTLRTAQGTQTRWVGTQAGFLSTSAREVHFGIGSAREAESVQVTWAGGEQQEFGPLQAGATWLLEQGKTEATRVDQP